MAIGLYLQHYRLSVAVLTVNCAGQVVQLDAGATGSSTGPGSARPTWGTSSSCGFWRCCFREVVAVRRRRLYSIALLSMRESNRRMWAPWVVVTMFLLILAFTHWFIQPPRPAEMGRLYVGTLSLLCSMLLTVMVTIMTPLSLPTDIQQQTIYTVVSKPVRRLELIWGRMIGYMAHRDYPDRGLRRNQPVLCDATVGARSMPTVEQAKKAKKENRVSRPQAADRTGRPASHPDAGSGSDQGLAVVPRLARHCARRRDRRGQRTVTMREPRSHIEGATPVGGHLELRRSCRTRSPPPGRPPSSRPQSRSRISAAGHQRVAPRPGLQARAQIEAAQAEKNQPNVTAARVSQLDAAINRNQHELDARSANTTHAEAVPTT